MGRSLGAQARGNPLAIQGVHPVEAFGDFACLVALQLPDEVPVETRRAGKRCDLVDPFLDVVLAEFLSLIHI